MIFVQKVLEKVEVWETLSRQGKGHCYRLYRVRLAFLPERYYAVSHDLERERDRVLIYLILERFFLVSLLNTVGTL